MTKPTRKHTKHVFTFTFACAALLALTSACYNSKNNGHDCQALDLHG